MLNTVVLFGIFGIVPLIHCTYQVAGNTAYSLKRNMLKFVMQVGKFIIYGYVQRF